MMSKVVLWLLIVAILAIVGCVDGASSSSLFRARALRTSQRHLQPATGSTPGSAAPAAAPAPVKSAPRTTGESSAYRRGQQGQAKDVNDRHHAASSGRFQKETATNTQKQVFDRRTGQVISGAPVAAIAANAAKAASKRPNYGAKCTLASGATDCTNGAVCWTKPGYSTASYREGQNDNSRIEYSCQAPYHEPFAPCLGPQARHDLSYQRDPKTGKGFFLPTDDHCPSGFKCPDYALGYLFEGSYRQEGKLCLPKTLTIRTGTLSIQKDGTTKWL